MFTLGLADRLRTQANIMSSDVTCGPLAFLDVAVDVRHRSALQTLEALKALLTLSLVQECLRED